MDTPSVTLPIPKGCSIPIPIGSAVDVVANIWRETRDEDVARRLIALSEEHASYFRPHVPKKGRMFEDLVEHRVDSLLTLLLRSVTHGTDASASARIRAIFEKWGPDPRVRSYLDRWSDANPYPSGWEFSPTVKDILGQWAAREAAEPKPRGLNELDHRLLGHVDNVIASFAKRRLAFGLLNDVYTYPTDIQRRLVLADALMDLGDSWGELIALQCREQPGPESRPLAKQSREDELIRDNKNVWLGRLLPHVYEQHDVEFEHGFPAVVSPVPMPRAMGLIEWSTVRELSRKKVHYSGPEIMTLNLLARLPCLREAKAVVVTARNRPPPHLPFRNLSLEHLSLRISAYNPVERAAAMTRLRNVQSFPNLKRLDFIDWGLANDVGQFNSVIDLKNSRFGKSIRELGMTDSLPRILERTAERMAQRQELPTFHSLVDVSSFQFDPKARELWLILGKAIEMRNLGDIFKEAKIERVRVEANGDAYTRAESESRAWKSSLGSATKIEVKRRAAGLGLVS